MAKHATKSASGAVRWMACAGSIQAERGLPDNPSAAALEGTTAHALAARALLGAGPMADELGVVDPETGLAVTAEMIRHVSRYVAMVQDTAKSCGVEPIVETPLPIGLITGEIDPDTGGPAMGTPDALILAKREIIVADFKYGAGHRVEVVENRQLMLYALAALDEHDLTAGPFETARLIIDQPRNGGLSEWSVSVADLEKFRVQAREASEACDAPDAPRTPTEEGCQYCRARTTCPELRALIDEAQGLEVAGAPAEALGRAMELVPFVESWAKAVRQEVDQLLRAGAPVPGFKLVKGRAPNRQWSDEAEAAALLKKARLKPDQIYSMSLISPAKAEELQALGAIGPRNWAKVQALIERPEAGLTIAPATDKRPAVNISRTASETDFDDLASGQPQSAASDSDFDDLAGDDLAGDPV